MAIIRREYDNAAIIAALTRRVPELNLGPNTRVEDIDITPRFGNSGEYGGVEIKIVVPLPWGDIDDILSESQV